jgi:uncharacterized membrane protein YhhN
MPYTTPLLLAAALLLAGLLWAEAHGRSQLVLALKTPLSCLFILAALLADHSLPSYYHLILAGLVLGLVGDVCLACPGQNAFRAGLVAFLLGHLFYVAAFVGLVGLSNWPGLPLAGLALAACAVFLWLRSRVGALLIPVILYILVISLMAAGAWAVYSQAALPETAARAVLAGALLFYLSDLLVARDRFVAPQFVNRLLGLPLYYAGQFLLAFSVGWAG